MPNISPFTIVQQCVGQCVVCKVLNGDIFTGTLQEVTQEMMCILENVSYRVRNHPHRRRLAKVYLSNRYIRHFILPGGRKVPVPPSDAIALTEANLSQYALINFLNFVVIRYANRVATGPEQHALPEIPITEEEARLMQEGMGEIFLQGQTRTF